MKINLKKIIKVVSCFLVLTCFGQNTSAQYITNASAGSIRINGDIQPVKDVLNYISFGLSRELKHNLLIESKIGFGKAFGLNPELASIGSQNGYLVEDEYSILGENQWFPAYRNNLLMLDFSLNYRPNLGVDWFKIIGGAGLGITKSSRSLNLLGLEDSFYNNSFSSLNSRDRIQAIKNYYDVTYETPFETGSSLSGHITLQLAVQFRINDYLYLNIEVRHHITNSDYIDVVSYQSLTEQTGNNDSISMLSIGFAGYLTQPTNTRLVHD